MGREGKPEEYNGEGYLKSGVYERYLPLYEAAINYLPPINKCETVVDLGCGVGYFTSLFFKKGYTKYIGIDFAPAMLEKFKKQVPEATFILGDLRSREIYKIFQKHKIFIILETLEHIEKDLDIIRSIPCGSLVIFSVPNYDSRFHVRHFKTVNDVIKRFEKFLEFKDNQIHSNKKKNKIKKFLFKCIRNDKE